MCVSKVSVHDVHLEGLSKETKTKIADLSRVWGDGSAGWSFQTGSVGSDFARKKRSPTKIPCQDLYIDGFPHMCSFPKYVVVVTPLMGCVTMGSGAVVSKQNLHQQSLLL